MALLSHSNTHKLFWWYAMGIIFFFFLAMALLLWWFFTCLRRFPILCDELQLFATVSYGWRLLTTLQLLSYLRHVREIISQMNFKRSCVMFDVSKDIIYVELVDNLYKPIYIARFTVNLKLKVLYAMGTVYDDSHLSQERWSLLTSNSVPQQPRNYKLYISHASFYLCLCRSHEFVV